MNTFEARRSRIISCLDNLGTDMTRPFRPGRRRVAFDQPPIRVDFESWPGRPKGAEFGLTLRVPGVPAPGAANISIFATLVFDNMSGLETNEEPDVATETGLGF